MVCVRMYVHAHTGVQKSASASASASAWGIPRNGDYYCSQLQGPFMDRVNSRLSDRDVMMSFHHLITPIWLCEM